jgi:hypothetical protein
LEVSESNAMKKVEMWKKKAESYEIAEKEMESRIAELETRVMDLTREKHDAMESENKIRDQMEARISVTTPSPNFLYKGRHLKGRVDRS